MQQEKKNRYDRIAPALGFVLIALTVITLHRANIKRLLAGEEKQISFSGPKK